ncbi:MAG TPA: 50S ribosomal protein L25 [Acidimicrobiales bacterium]|nr:50S ribosomal protein L25 [Acidimicrobiales bacterium]
MAEITLVAEAGRQVGTRPSRRQRTAGRIPGVVYGNGVDPISVSVAARELRAALSTEAGLNALLSLDVGGRTYLTLARELQRHPVRGTLLHVDFQVVDPDREVSADVPVTLVGDAVELHRADGVLEQMLFALPVKARPADIPSHLEVDISALTVGTSVRVGDVVLPARVTADLDPEATVAVGQAPRVAAVEVAEGEVAEGEGGAAGEGVAPAAEGGAAAPAEEG